MDWGFILHHLTSGVLPVAAALALYFILLRMLGKKPGAGHTVISFVFCFYLIGILTMTGVCLRGSFSPRIVCIPFADMIRGPVDMVLNILLFVPMGVFLPLLYREFDRLRRIALAGFLVSFSVEAAQMFGSGATDINDLITNTLGACLGYGLYKSLHRAIPKARIEKTRIEGPLCFLEPLLFWGGSLLCMLTVQIPIFHALFAGRMAGGELQLWK